MIKKDRRWITLIFLWLLMPLLLQGAIFRGWCVKVVDGDQLVVYVNKKTLKVRLAHVDCPEMGQPFGEQARELTSSLTLKKKVQVEIKSYGENDQLIGRVTIDGKDLSMTLVESGLAWYYKKHGSERYLSKAQRKARKGKIGLWSQNNPIPPWDFRRQAGADKQ